MPGTQPPRAILRGSARLTYRPLRPRSRRQLGAPLLHPRSRRAHALRSPARLPMLKSAATAPGIERLRAASRAEPAYSPRGGRRRARRRLREACCGHCEALARVFRCPAGAEPAAPPQRLSTAPPPPMRGRGPPLNANGRGPGACALGARRGSARAGRPSGGRLGGTRLGGGGRAWGEQGWRQDLRRAGTRGRPAASAGGWGGVCLLLRATPAQASSGAGGALLPLLPHRFLARAGEVTAWRAWHAGALAPVRLRSPSLGLLPPCQL